MAEVENPHVRTYSASRVAPDRCARRVGCQRGLQRGHLLQDAQGRSGLTPLQHHAMPMASRVADSGFPLKFGKCDVRAAHESNLNRYDSGRRGLDNIAEAKAWSRRFSFGCEVNLISVGVSFGEEDFCGDGASRYPLQVNSMLSAVVDRKRQFSPRISWALAGAEIELDQRLNISQIAPFFPRRDSVVQASEYRGYQRDRDSGARNPVGSGEVAEVHGHPPFASAWNADAYESRAA